MGPQHPQSGDQSTTTLPGPLGTPHPAPAPSIAVAHAANTDNGRDQDSFSIATRDATAINDTGGGAHATDDHHRTRSQD